MNGKAVLVAHADRQFLDDIVPTLSDLGYDVVGPARSAREALAYVAQTGVELALIGERLAGERDGRTLGQALRANWGVCCAYLKDRAGTAA
ncbi:hypothetical protein [Phenylobacterium sp.]|mgnify:CR=1 FL=1|uniref:hypothetical protein n=1 Tax=Phenylobacterium sp. TaxID=1871053 RepID=UPI002FE3499B